MRIQPVISSYNSLKRLSKNQTQFERNENNIRAAHRGNHQYSGNWSVDLAYASLVDKNIANDLRDMGLIV